MGTCRATLAGCVALLAVAALAGQQRLGVALEVRESRFGGRGVFTRRPILKGRVIERSPYLTVSPEHSVGEVQDYVFGHQDGEHNMLVLGHGSMFNHSDAPNAEYRQTERDMVYVAARNIAAGEEILISYGPAWWDTRELAKIK